MCVVGGGSQKHGWNIKSNHLWHYHAYRLLWSQNRIWETCRSSATIVDANYPNKWREQSQCKLKLCGWIGVCVCTHVPERVNLCPYLLTTKHLGCSEIMRGVWVRWALAKRTMRRLTFVCHLQSSTHFCEIAHQLSTLILRWWFTNFVTICTHGEGQNSRNCTRLLFHSIAVRYVNRHQLSVLLNNPGVSFLLTSRNTENRISLSS